MNENPDFGLSFKWIIKVHVSYLGSCTLGCQTIMKSRFKKLLEVHSEHEKTGGRKIATPYLFISVWQGNGT